MADVEEIELAERGETATQASETTSDGEILLLSLD